MSSDLAIRARRLVLPRIESASDERRAISLPSSWADRSRLALVGFELDDVGRVGALEFLKSPVGQMEHLVDRPVEKPDVVGDEQDGSSETLELVHQPTLGRPVEVVGGLVEDHGVGRLEKDPHEVHPAALTTRQAVDIVEQELLA